MVKETVEPKIKGSLPSALAGAFHFDTVTLGDVPLRFGSIVATAVDYKSVRSGDTKNVEILFNTIYRGNAQVDLSFAGAKLGIRNIEMVGDLSINLVELLDRPPFFSGVAVYFTNPPHISMDWSGVAGVLGVGVIKSKIREVVTDGISNVCVLPKRIVSDMDPKEERLFRLLAPFPPGCLRLELIAARDLAGKDFAIFGKATSDPYANVRIGAQMQKSKTVKKDCNPKWNEPFDFCVYDKHQNVRIDVYDEDFGGGDDELGMLEMTVDELLNECREGPAWIKLMPQEEEDKVQGELQLKVTWLPVTFDSERAAAIDVAKGMPQALLFLGMYSVKIPPAKVGTTYTIEATCNGKTNTVTKTTALDPDEVKTKAQVKDLQPKIDKMVAAKMKDSDIAEILAIPVEALKDKGKADVKYTDRLVVKEPFLWPIDVPKETVVEIKVTEKDGTTDFGVVQVEAFRYLDDNKSAQRDYIQSKNGKIECEIRAQIRIIDTSF
jgi:hypothetical protein